MNLTELLLGIIKFYLTYVDKDGDLRLATLVMNISWLKELFRKVKNFILSILESRTQGQVSLKKRKGMKRFSVLLIHYYRNRNTIGQFITIPTDPYSPPPRPVIHPCSTKPKMANSSVSREAINCR